MWFWGNVYSNLRCYAFIKQSGFQFLLCRWLIQSNFHQKWRKGVQWLCSECLSLKEKSSRIFTKKVIVENMPGTTSEPFAVLKLYSNGMANLNFWGRHQANVKLQFRYFRQFRCGIAGFYVFLRDFAFCRPSSFTPPSILLTTSIFPCWG